MSKSYSIFKTVLTISAVWLVWQWGFCRFYVEPNQMAIVISKTGKALPAGQILADKGQKGIQKNVLGEGRHFLNPIVNSWEIAPVTTIPAGKVGIVTSKVGQELPAGEFLASTTEKGIWKSVLGPGKYRINPYGYQIDVIDAISIPVGYAGVVTSLSGTQAKTDEFATIHEKGVMKDILQPGLYYINPKAFKIDVLEIGVNQVSLLAATDNRNQVRTKQQLASKNAAMQELQNNVLMEQKQKRLDYFSKSLRSSHKGVIGQNEQQQLSEAKADMEGGGISGLILQELVEFPSRDGFQIRLDMTVEIELLPNEISWIFSRFGDLPALIDKIIMPQITSVSRNKGSEYHAKDFIMGDGREKFQNELTKTLAERLRPKRIIVHNALIRHVEVPEQILAPIQQASVAIEQNLTNVEKQNTAKKQAELNTETAMIDQSRGQVMEETEKVKAGIKADEEMQVATIKAETGKKVAEIARDTAIVKAATVEKLGEANASAIKLVEGELARGLQLKATALNDPIAFGLWEFANQFNTKAKINIIHTGEGTLWTDLEKAGAGNLGGAVLLQGNNKKK